MSLGDLISCCGRQEYLLGGPFRRNARSVARPVGLSNFQRKVEEVIIGTWFHAP